MTDFPRPLSRAALVKMAALAAAAVAAGVRPASADDDTVTIGIVKSTSDVPFFIAEKMGYFREAGIVPKFVTFDSGAKMIAPLGVGQLDVGGGGPSVGLYNAIARGIEMRIVADKASMNKGFGMMPLLVRKALVDSGKYRGPKDLKGMKVAESAQGSSAMPDLASIMALGGLTYNDVQHLYMPFGDHVLSLQSGAIDASLTAEPSATLAVRSGAAVRVMTSDTFSPGQALAVLLYGGNFARNRKPVAERFMVAYLRAVRYYNDGLVGNKLKGRTANEIVKIMTESTSIKDPSIYFEAVPGYNDPNGHVSIRRLADDLNYFKSQNLIQGDVQIANVVDTSFAEAAVKQLGPYKPHK